MPPQETNHPLPWVVHIGAVAPDIIGLQIQSRRILPPKTIEYSPQPGDTLVEKPNGTLLMRNEQEVGFIIEKDGPKSFIFIGEQPFGLPLDEKSADSNKSYRIRWYDGDNATQWINPVAIWRKSQVNGWGEDREKPAIRHHLYLKLPTKLQKGTAYEIVLQGIDVSPRFLAFYHNPERIRSEAIHCTHLGYRPNDPGKCAYLSCWMGTGGGLHYPDGMTFALIDDASDRRVYEGSISWCWPEEKIETYVRKVNYNRCDVYRMDFADFNTPGTYRVVVDGIGCSYPFRIAENVWTDAFKLSMKGFYHQRSGIPIGPPHGSFSRPRPYHPDDGVKVYHNTVPLLISSNGLDALGNNQIGTADFAMLKDGVTDEIVPNAWGGYMDAGDFDRRIKHLDATRLHLELIELFPDFYKNFKLAIPESDGDLPDLIHEILFSIEVYHRLQRNDEAVRGGIEAIGLPNPREGSWQDSQVIFAYQPDVWSSYIYAGIAARLVRVLRAFPHAKAAALVEEYERSALSAMKWAEAEYERLHSSGELQRYRRYAQIHIREERALAALELYVTTNNVKFHKLFMSTHDFTETHGDLSLYYRRAALDAAFLYTMMPQTSGEYLLFEQARSFTINAANRALKDAQGNAWSKEHAYRSSVGFAGLTEMEGPAHGHFSVPASATLLRGHALTGNPDLLEVAIRSAQFSSGCNPLNRALTTGMGYDPVGFISHGDTRKTGQPAPTGITVYGLFDIPYYKDHQISTLSWAPKYYLHDQCTPSVYEWPIGESYFDVGCWLPNTEFTIHHTLGPTSYAYGYLAARNGTEQSKQ